MRSTVNKWIRYFFGISRTESNGVIVMAIIMLLIALVPFIFGIISRPEHLDFKQSQKLDSLIATLDQNLILQEENDSIVAESGDSISYFTFDPNTAGNSDFLRLGLSPEISNRIIKYRESGGNFNKREDFARIYGLTDAKFRELLPYIKIYKDDKEMQLPVASKLIQSEPDNSVIDREGKEMVQFDINLADSSELVVVNGIGTTLSGRIVRFRESLGGFVDMKQLQEVYGIEQYAYDNLVKQAFIGKNFVPKTIPINEWHADSLARHPYIDARKARVIVAYREQHGRYSDPGDLMEILVLEKSWVEKLTPYLDF